MRKITKIIIHCSDSNYGDFEAIDEWHKERGWDGCGYHYLLLNGYRSSTSEYKAEDDGILEKGRDDRTAGAHCYGHNGSSIGICIIGKHLFSTSQIFDALPTLLSMLCLEYDLTVDDIYGHHEFNSNKACPNMDMDMLRGYLKQGGLQ